MAIIYLDNQAEEALEVGDKRFFRYYSLGNAQKSISNSNFWFSNPSEWEDPFEKLFIEAKYKYNGQNYDFPFKNQLFCFCITEEDNSLASWKAYSDDQITIRFQINTKEFVSLLELQTDFQVYIGKVRYLATKQINGKTGPVNFDLKNLFNNELPYKNKLDLLLLKRYAFRYEKEYRIILVSKSITERKKGIVVPYNPNLIHELISEIKIGPSKDVQLVQNLKNQFKSLGVKKVSQSKLISPFEPREYKLKSLNL